MTDKQAEGDQRSDSQRIAEWLGEQWHEPYYRRSEFGNILGCKLHGANCDISILYRQPDYTNATDCLALIEAVRARGYEVIIDHDERLWYCSLNTDDAAKVGEGVTLPEAVSSAVLALIVSEEAR